jgi:ubiquinone/menaquinone biosynthesis C-methylase UbiE
MKDKIKTLLKRWPSLYYFVQVWYWRVCSLKIRLVGTKIVEKRWAKIKNKNQIIKEYQEGRNHLHRQLLIRKIESYFPVSSILEIGCNCGPNIFLLAKKFPKVEIYGIDINPLAIQIGKEFLTKEGISNVKLLVGKADELNQFQDKSFDIVFTDAVLMYVGPDKIKKVIKETARIAKKVLIFTEWHYKEQKGLGAYDPHFGLWKRNYLDLLRDFFSEDQIYISKIPEELWPNENWQKFGYLIEVKL